MGLISYHDSIFSPTHLPSTGVYFFGTHVPPAAQGVTGSPNILELERWGDFILRLQVNVQILLERCSISSWSVFGKQSLTLTYNQSSQGRITNEQEVLSLIRVKSSLLQFLPLTHR